MEESCGTLVIFFFQAEDGIRDGRVTGVQTCALPISLADGTITAIATDHAPHAGSEKMQEFERCPFGIIGLETAIGLTLEYLVAPGKITLTRMVELDRKSVV